VILMATALFTAACAAPLKPKEIEPQQASIQQVRTQHPIAVRARLTGDAKRKLSMAGPDVVVSEDEFTSALVNGLIQTLRQHSVRVDPGAERSIEVQVVRVSLQPTMTFDCVIDFNRWLGQGPVRGLQSRANSWNFQNACNAALSQAAADTLNDPGTRAYLEGN
jgi:hypothetical protein